jgi:hypothetical protein
MNLLATGCRIAPASQVPFNVSMNVSFVSRSPVLRAASRPLAR